MWADYYTMLKRVHFTPLAQAEKLAGRPDVIVISIHDRHYLPNLRSGFRDVLRLHFDDYDQERDGIDALQDSFTPEQAETLKSWLEPYLRANSEFTLLVHCYAGISRSAAVAWWAHKTHGLELMTDFPAWYLNRQVLRTLDPDIAPPIKPNEAPAMPSTQRAFEKPPLLVAVEISVTRHPPHRSLRAELPHKAPASGHDANLSLG